MSYEGSGDSWCEETGPLTLPCGNSGWKFVAAVSYFGAKGTVEKSVEVPDLIDSLRLPACGRQILNFRGGGAQFHHLTERK